MKVKIISAGKTLYEGKSSVITLPGREGEFQALENHAPIFALLKKGEIVVGKEKKKFPISSGVIEVLNNIVTILIKEAN